jgi:hypothetical protein
MVSISEKNYAEQAFAFLGCLVSSLPEGDYTADAGRWATAISYLRNKYSSSYPKLFRNIHFRNAPKRHSYSPEVSNFLTFLQFTDATEVHNPGFVRMSFQRDAIELLRTRCHNVLSKKDQAIIESMGKEIAGQLQPRYP